MSINTARTERLIRDVFDSSFSNDLIKIMKHNKTIEAQNGPESLATLFLADLFYNKIIVGKFKGLPNLVWSGQFEDGKTPKFIYVPNETQPFQFTRHNGQVISPHTMDTDGGSIPSCLHSLKDFGPWDFALGYMIHDWIFVAKNCNHDTNNMFTFEESAMILAECIKTIMEVGFVDFDDKNVQHPKNEDALYIIFLAVSSWIAKEAWNDPDSYFCRLDQSNN